MPISDKTRKLLWGRSGNRCSICRQPLSIVAGGQKHVLIGEECHIAARSGGGPRFNGQLPEDDRDSYDNLLLLCANDHKIVDERIDVYTQGKLLDIKKSHELWVEKSLHLGIKSNIAKSGAPDFLLRIFSGQELLKIVGDAGMADFQHDDPLNQEEADAIGCFLQSCQDYGEIYGLAEAGSRVQMAYNLTQEIKKIEEKGIWVFGARWIQPLLSNGNRLDMETAGVHLHRGINPLIIAINPQTEKIPINSLS